MLTNFSAKADEFFLSVFDHFVGLALKGLKCFYAESVGYNVGSFQFSVIFHIETELFRLVFIR